MTFENIITQREIARDEQFLLLPQCLQLYSVSTLAFTEIFHIFKQEDIFKSALLQIVLYVGKGYICYSTCPGHL